jgi:topoisomerase (DNA) II binding protein 1
MSIPMSAPSLQADEPCDPFMAGLTFHHAPVAGKDAADVQEYVKAMQRAGAVVTPHHDARVTHVVLSKTGPAGSEDEALHKAAGRAGSRVVSWFWIQECLKANELVPVDDSVLFRPLPSLEGLPEMRDLKVCVTGYTGDRRAELITIVGLLGAEYMRALDRRSTHLVCYEFEGAKWAKANQTKLQKIVSHRWLEQCLEKWTALPEAPFAERSGKEEDALAAAAAEDPEIPDSDDEGAIVEDSLATEPAEPAGGSAAERARARKSARAPEGSFGTFVTELTAGAAAGAGARGVVGADDDVAPGTVLRDVSSAQEAAEREEGERDMQPPAPRAPRSASQSQGKSRGLAPGALLPGSELLSPDWGALELRASQHIERSRRDVELDPTLLALRDRGEPIAAAQLAFAGRVGSPDAVEAAFGGRFADRQPARFHAFGDGDAPLAAEDFAAFARHVAAGVWEPDVDERNANAKPAWLRRVLAGETRFETLAARPAGVGSSAVSVTEPAPGLFLACLSSARAEDVARWGALCVDSKTRSARGPLGAAVLARLQMETAKQPDGDGALAGPDALLRTFLEVYCPFGHEMGWSSLRAMLRPAATGRANAEKSSARLRLRDAGEVVTLPRRTPGNLEGVTLCEVRRPLSEVLAGFHELLAGPTEPDMTQAAPAEALPAPPRTKSWTVDHGTRMSVQACAPGSQAAVAAASAGWLAADEPAEAPRDDAPAREGPSPETRDARPDAREEEAVDINLAARLDACAGAGAETEAPPAADEATRSEDEDAVAPGRRARRGGARARPVLLTQDTTEDEGVDLGGDGDGDGEEKDSAAASVPRARRARAAKTPVTKTPVTKTPVTKTPVAVAARATRSKTPAAAAKTAKITSSASKKTSSASKKTSSKLATRGAEASGSGPRGVSSPPAAARRPRVALSGFGSADLTKYGATATRLGASLCAGHAWDPRATHVVFGPRGSRSIKFLAAAASGVPLLDASFLDASRRAGALLGPETFGDHLWRGGWRGADAGLVAPDAAKRWLSRRQKAQARGSGEDARPFAGLVVAVAPFPSSNRVERDMLVEVLRAGGARVSTVSAKGALIPAAPAPDVAVVDPGSFAGADAAAGRAGAAAAAAAGGACVAPEFFKSWLSRPGASLAQHVLRGEVVGALADALARTSGAGAEETDEEAEPPAPRSTSRAEAPPRAAKPAPQAKATEAAASEAAGGSGTKRVSAKDRAMPIVGKRRRVLAPRN